MAADFDAEQVIQEVTGVLKRKYPDKDAAEVEQVVRAQVDELKDRPVSDYISVLAQRAAKKQLKGS
jgi:predicted nucleic acid-binding protein